MTFEYGRISNIRFLQPKKYTPEDENEWRYVLDRLPKDGEKVLCYGNKTICCELDMEEAAEHNAIFRIKESSWKERENGDRYDIKTYPSFDLDPQDELYHLIFVSRWKNRKS